MGVPGRDALHRHRPGSAETLVVLLQLAGVEHRQ
jgi:hypothetical protein